MLEGYKIEVKRSNRKTASIYVERDGAVTVMVPQQLEDAAIQKLLKQNEYKIHKYQSKRQLLNEAAVTREPVNGQSFLYLGRNYYLQFNENADRISFHGRYLIVPHELKKSLLYALKDFYRTRGKDFLNPRVQKYAEKMDVHPEEVTVMDLKNRWASCSTCKPKVNFHWKIMMAPISVIDYIIVHELAHLKYKRHNADFWNVVDKVMPNYQKQVSWLKGNGASLDL